MILMSIQNILKEFRQHTAKNPAAGRALLQDHELTRSVCQRIVPAFSVDFITNSCHGHNQRRKPPNMGTITFYIRKFTTADFHIYNLCTANRIRIKNLPITRLSNVQFCLCIQDVFVHPIIFSSGLKAQIIIYHCFHSWITRGRKDH